MARRPDSARCRLLVERLEDRATPAGLLTVGLGEGGAPQVRAFDALTRFAAEEPAKAQLVQLRFFAGLTTPEAAAALGVSVATAERWWAYARTWLFSELEGGEESSSAP
jgi:hypothetical protein